MGEEGEKDRRRGYSSEKNLSLQPRWKSGLSGKSCSEGEKEPLNSKSSSKAPERNKRGGWGLGAPGSAGATKEEL